MQPHQLNPAIETQFEAVNDYIINHLGSNVPLVEKIGHYIVESGGKRIRPLLVLLAANVAGYKGKEHISLAAIIEFIHTATLLHDDVVDNSDLRRGKDTANAKWGNAPSVLVGDFLYSRAFQIMVEIGSMEIMSVISNATNVIAEGEVLQLLNTKNPDTTEDAYMQVILGKTAMLFEAATEAGAILANSSASEREALRLYGLHLGTAFQLIDDVMDYLSTAEEMGKNVGDDLAEGKATLPLIHAMRAGTEEQRLLVRQAIRKGGLDDLQPIMDIVKETGAIEYTQQKAQTEADSAIAALTALPDNSFKDTLIQIANIAVKRKS
ncbi:octaprenyl diphosphate synthase [Neptuniibacter pectenicola]|jgi:octaprenyl-diphosphate synthase|uniref:octaprenyl diphosphate synthase n=1 Tax=Neptuniibacter pectenicola TaxID=1806669 RepID=UPI0007998B41|nr:MAG: octaprenyl diphosphate synthase [Neptuniibacter sp. Phe_28]|tara:strand:- start:6024 stop:6992 length:969 start_codon:yes stop_codon:yes gene_type:complete